MRSPSGTLSSMELCDICVARVCCVSICVVLFGGDVGVDDVWEKRRVSSRGQWFGYARCWRVSLLLNWLIGCVVGCAAP
jgi:hypothetical protein